jgi:hypothetical protein
VFAGKLLPSLSAKRVLRAENFLLSNDLQTARVYFEFLDSLRHPLLRLHIEGKTVLDGCRLYQ